VQQMVKLLLGLAALPSPHDAADALAVAICHAHAMKPFDFAQGKPAMPAAVRPRTNTAKSWRQYRPART